MSARTLGVKGLGIEGKLAGQGGEVTMAVLVLEIHLLRVSGVGEAVQREQQVIDDRVARGRMPGQAV